MQEEIGMVPTSKEDLTKLVTQATLETYEELSPQLIVLLDQVKHNDQLTKSQKNDEIMLNMMGDQRGPAHLDV